MTQFRWPDVPARERTQVESLQHGLEAVLGPKLIGVYLHGSLALGCFNPARSDIDAIAVADRAPTEDEQRALVELTLRLSERGPPPRKSGCPLELSIVTAADLNPWRYPTPYVFHFGESWRLRLEGGELPSSGTDHDLAAHLTVLRHAGVALSGPAVATTFPTVPPADYRDSLLRDLTYAKEERLGLYGVLTGSRIWATLATGRLHSKDSGAAWVETRAAPRFRPLVSTALRVYRGESDEPVDPAETRAYLDAVEAELRGCRCRPGSRRGV